MSRIDSFGIFISISLDYPKFLDLTNMKTRVVQAELHCNSVQVSVFRNQSRPGPPKTLFGIR